MRLTPPPPGTLHLTNLCFRTMSPMGFGATPSCVQLFFSLLTAGCGRRLHSAGCQTGTKSCSLWLSFCFPPSENIFVGRVFCSSTKSFPRAPTHLQHQAERGWVPDRQKCHCRSARYLLQPHLASVRPSQKFPPPLRPPRTHPRLPPKSVTWQPTAGPASCRPATSSALLCCPGLLFCLLKPQLPA